MVLNSSNVSEESHNLDEAIKRLEVHDNHEGDDVDSNRCPDRPGEPDCIHYVKTMLCADGSNCRYNHPTHYEQGTQATGELPERVDQPDCKHYLEKGMCKFGAACKYHHPRDRPDAQPVLVNVLGLPIRQDQKSCSYYMRTGTCKFGVVCKFNHPQPATLWTVLPLNGSPTSGSTIPSMTSTARLPLVDGVSSWPLSNRPTYTSSHHLQNLAAYTPVILPPSPGIMPVQQGWPAYMGFVNHQLSPDVLGPTLIPKSNNITQSSLSNTPNFPERPDRPECHYYMKTGNCKYGSTCKFHHPKERSSVSTSTLGPLGLPLRPDQPVCTYYSLNGTCWYGSICKFDHPLIGCYDYNMPATCRPDDFRNQRNTQVAWTPWEAKPTKTMKSEADSRPFPSNNNKEDKNIAAHTSSTLHVSPSSESTQTNSNYI
ncbi:hypothetical protein IEQ34_013200 [Dendrobium chrysotoxum]|uniref:C3H1-type domain-containing protein n=1 Tax=Dendrobium chrysotoxum TaxID=161865 RepID=A0AAV7GNU1_DENCH|nr:hypothetical protein IEQ34_013200 [Dendrobium chrysotoxum]